MNGQKVVKVFCHEEAAERDFDAINDQLFDDANHAQRYANIFMPIMGNIGNILYVLTAFLGGLLICSGGSVPNLSFQNLFETGSMIAPLKIAVVASFLGMTKQFTGNVSQVSQQINAIVMAAAGASRVFELIDQQPEDDNGRVTLVNAVEAADGTLTESAARTGVWAWKCPQEDGKSRLVKLCGDVRFFDVDFAYDPEKPVLHDISLYAKPGQKLAFVGATGAGKTTITNLINRFYDIADGKIRYDGININHIKKADLRHSLGIVLQDVNLFTGTVMDNIRYGKLDATDEECIAAAKLANAHDFITRLPDGYNTMLTGQRREPLAGPAAAAVHRPRGGGRPPGHDPRRGDQLHRHAHGAAGTARHGRAHEGPDGVRHRAPAVDGAEFRRHHGPRPRPHHRARHPRRSDRPEGHLLSALHRRI